MSSIKLVFSFLNKTIGLLLFNIVILFFLFSCKRMEKNDVIPMKIDTAKITETTTSVDGATNIPEGVFICGDVHHYDFLAGQNIHMGEVKVYNTKESLFIEISTIDSWFLNQTHVYIGPKENMPQTPTGNPKLGLFPFNTSHDPGTTHYIYEVPLKTFDECFDVVIHAEVFKKDNKNITIQQETAYAKGEQINGKGSWAMYNNYCVQNCSCVFETTFAKMIAGQTMTVGAISITNDAENLFVTYETSGDWFIKETHLYVGDIASMPINKANTPIPGQFPFKNSFTTETKVYTYTIPLLNLPSCYSIAAHATVERIINNEVLQHETSWSEGTNFENTNRWGSYSSYCTQYCP